MTKEYETIINSVSLPYRWALGPSWTRFFDGLKEEKIYGTECKKCKKVFVPAKSFCPDCYEDLDKWSEVGHTGTLKTWTVVEKSYHGQTKEPPYVIGLIRLDGADCDFIHFIGGIDEKSRKKLKQGTKVKAVWSQEKHADIYDISYFKPLK
jgi:hypothetical protein